MFEKVDINSENCLMFEWVKNAIEGQKLSLVKVPRNPKDFKVFIDAFYDQKSQTPGRLHQKLSVQTLC